MQGNIFQNEVKNMEHGIKVYMYWEISIRMRRWRIGNRVSKCTCAGKYRSEVGGGEYETGSESENVQGNIYQNEVKNIELGIKVYMYWEISIRMRRRRI